MKRTNHFDVRLRSITEREVFVDGWMLLRVSGMRRTTLAAKPSSQTMKASGMLTPAVSKANTKPSSAVE
ncbi:MAG: hypothetical protein J07HQW2_00428 [Haloquadratum walsbyi J07HQW2]|uniref:Uncharacterized protein n=1 Tax=Haloquadratum walsbyi J07HQW2 TaxID=1238425 RepID=U1MUI1_9EURY|nr:MAG: hypothetical protein J07HQW2_00428 [Haloquadratum walsbyi J07HQW2]